MGKIVTIVTTADDLTAGALSDANSTKLDMIVLLFKSVPRPIKHFNVMNGKFICQNYHLGKHLGFVHKLQIEHRVSNLGIDPELLVILHSLY